MKCEHCGCEGAIKKLRYIGGQGLVEAWLCEDRRECWRRWDEQNLKVFERRGKSLAGVQDIMERVA